MAKKTKTKKKIRIVIPDWINLDLLKAEASAARAYALPERSGLFVGCAVMDSKRNIFTGANLEVLWQESYHAEETAILTAKTHDAGTIEAICISAERKLFTPCGRCMDLIFKFASPNAVLLHQNPKTYKTSIFYIKELMPYYPTHT